MNNSNWILIIEALLIAIFATSCNAEDFNFHQDCLEARMGKNNVNFMHRNVPHSTLSSMTCVKSQVMYEIKTDAYDGMVLQIDWEDENCSEKVYKQNLYPSILDFKFVLEVEYGIYLYCNSYKDFDDFRSRLRSCFCLRKQYGGAFGRKIKLNCY